MAQSQPAPPPAPSEIDLRTLYFAVLARWPFILAAAIAGSLLGIAFAVIVPDRYQAVAELSVGIDYSRAEFLDEDAERHILLRVQDLLLSDAVLGATLDGLPVGTVPEGARPSLTEFGERVRLTRIEARWNMAVIDSDPVLAAALANAWAESALQVLEDSQVHAWRAAELQAAFFEIACRPGDTGLWQCDEFGPNSLAEDLREDLLREVQASNGISPAVSFGRLNSAAAPAQPVTSGRAVLGIAGTLLGLLIGTGLTLRACAQAANRLASLMPEAGGSSNFERNSEGP